MPKIIYVSVVSGVPGTIKYEYKLKRDFSNPLPDILIAKTVLNILQLSNIFIK